MKTNVLAIVVALACGAGCSHPVTHTGVGNSAYRFSAAIQPLRDTNDCSRAFFEDRLEWPISLAICEDDIPRLKSLLNRRGAWIEENDRYGTTPLTLAVQKCNEEAVSLLLHRGANPDHIDNNGLSPLMVAVSGYSGDRAELERMGVQPRGYEERTRLFDRIVELLLNHGAHVNLESAAGTTALDLALLYHRESTSAILRKYGARGGSLFPSAKDDDAE